MSNIERSCQLLCFGVPGIVSLFFVLLPGPGDQKKLLKKEIRESAIHGLSSDERFGALGILLPELTGVSANATPFFYRSAPLATPA